MTYYERQRAKQASERGRRMAKARWAADRARRDRLAAAEAEMFSGKIVRRIIVVDSEKEVREAVIWSFDSRREARRKLNSVLRSQ